MTLECNAITVMVRVLHLKRRTTLILEKLYKMRLKRGTYALMDDYEKEVFGRLKNDLIHYAKKCLKIRTKSGDIEPFLLNKAQLHIHNQLQNQLENTGKVRALVLKGRQQGCSTYVGARYYHRVTHSFGTQAFILTHALEATSNLYVMAKRYYEHTPDLVKPLVSKTNAKELVFGKLDSGYRLGTAENKNVGRSATIQLLHGSEVAFWNNAAEHSTGIMQAVPNAAGTEIILESTANGVGNYFHQQWLQAERGIGDFIPIFVPWYWQDEYVEPISDDWRITPEEQELSDQYGLSPWQLNWRRKKIVQLSVNGIDGEKAFRQEYPNNANEAFILTGEDSYIDSGLVVSARQSNVEAYGALLVGVDPARFGDDRTSIIFRRGRVAFDLKSYTKKDTMEVAGLVHSIILEKNPAKVFVDVGGLGAGVVDRLNELGHGEVVVAVNAGSSPLEGAKYKNKRAEMWGQMREWLSEPPIQIPDSDSLHSDLCGIKYKFDSNSRLVMESKEDMKKRGIRSSDEADALALTFALPPSALEASVNKKQEQVMDSLVNSFEHRARVISKSRR